MKVDFTFRKADHSDFFELKSLGRESYAEFSTVLTRENWKKMDSFLESNELLRKLIDQSTVFVCEKGTKLIGMIYLVPSGNPTELFSKDWSYIRFLGVHTEYRGKGIGKQLTDLCLEYAKATNEGYVALHTSEFMDSARTIYEKKGFRKTKEIEYLGKRYWIYLLNLR